jgi:hypothetical protein
LSYSIRRIINNAAAAATAAHVHTSAAATSDTEDFHSRSHYAIYISSV